MVELISKRPFRVIVLCEDSQRVCKAFRAVGIEAYSCDLLPCSGGHPEWHIQGDALVEAYSGKYQMAICHPPCTFMSKAGARFMYPTAGNIDPERLAKAMEAKAFFMQLLNAPIRYIAVENPTPLKVVGLPMPTQVIQPYEYGHPYSKRTLLWLKNLPPLESTLMVPAYTPFLPSNTGGVSRGQQHSRGTAKNAKEASTTFEGIAKAMAEQCGLPLIRNINRKIETIR